MLWGAQWWDVLTAFGTVGAVLVSLGLAVQGSLRARRAEGQLKAERQQRIQDERRSIAGLVSGWAESEYEPSRDGTHFVRSTFVYVANESSEPLYNIEVNISIGSPPVQLGPLSVPFPLPVLPARHRRSWDITQGVLAHSVGVGEVPTEPLVSLEFEDSHGVKWRRGYDGKLEREPPRIAILPPTENEGIKQLGPLESDFNPLKIATAFLAALAQAQSVKELAPFISPSASGWKDLTEDQMIETRDALAEFGLASHVWYPVSRIAYVRLVHDDDIEKLQRGEPGRGQIVTLVLLAGKGWRVFSIGPAVTEPDWIEFPRNDLNRDIRG